MSLFTRWSSLIVSLEGLLLLTSGLPGGPATAANDEVRTPIIVELFTSEGCSSCPPADAFLQSLDQSQPVPGVLVIALSEHVDYWDRLGWRDPFSSALFSRRQEAYGQRFRLDGVYTPQMIVDGTSEAVGSDSRKILEAIRKAATVAKHRVRISPVFTNGAGAPTVRVEVEASGKFAGGDRLMIALADDAGVSQVLRGENSGRKLKHVAVVRRMADFGSLGQAGSRSVDVPLTGELHEWNGRRIVAFVQNQKYGPIRGAAYRLLPLTASN